MSRISSGIDKYIVDWIIQRIKDVDGVTIGISGGLDSAVCAALAERACKITGKKLYLYSLPIHQNPDELNRADMVGAKYVSKHVRYDTFDLTDLYEVAAKALPLGDESGKKIRLGNIRARLRMVYLYNMAHATKTVVMSTDNLSELWTGFWTLHGDVGDISPIQEIYKGYELPELAREIGVPEEIINAVPTDGLGISSSDCEQLGARDYVEVDDAISYYLEDRINFVTNETSGNAHNVNGNILKRIRATEFKRENPISLSREALLDAETKIGVFSGTFDPMHVGHMYVLKSLVKAGFNKIYLDVAIPYNKETMFELRHRVAMVEIAAGLLATKYRHVEINVTSFGRKNGVTTLYDIVKGIDHIAPIWFVIGDDIVENVPKWYRINEIKDDVNFIVAPRTKGGMAKAIQKINRLKDENLVTSDENSIIDRQNKISICNTITPGNENDNISSSIIRQMILDKNVDGIKDLLPNSVCFEYAKTVIESMEFDDDETTEEQ